MLGKTRWSGLLCSITLLNNSTELDTGSFDGFVANGAMTASHEFSASLKSLTEFKFRGNDSDNIHLKGKRIRWKRQQQHRQFWSKVKEDAAVKAVLRDWIVDCGHSFPPYLVVGIMICEDLEIRVEAGTEHAKSVWARIPVIEATSGAGGVPAENAR